MVSTRIRGCCLQISFRYLHAFTLVSIISYFLWMLEPFKISTTLLNYLSCLPIVTFIVPLPCHVICIIWPISPNWCNISIPKSFSLLQCYRIFQISRVLIKIPSFHTFFDRCPPSIMLILYFLPCWLQALLSWPLEWKFFYELILFGLSCAMSTLLNGNTFFHVSFIGQIIIHVHILP